MDDNLSTTEAERRAAREVWAARISRGGVRCVACYGELAADSHRWTLPGGGPYVGRGPLHRACHDRARHGKAIVRRDR